MNNLTVFDNSEFGSIRTMLEGNTILFCGVDVARALGYSNERDALSRHCRGVVKRDGVSQTTNQHGTTTNQVNEMSFIPESDVYRLVFRSKLPNAEKFTDWVAEDVLPTIRKTGGYVNDEHAFVDTYLPFADERTKCLFTYTLMALNQANEKIKTDAPKVVFADAVSASTTSIAVGDLAKILRQSGVDTGQKRLFHWLRMNGYLIRRQGSEYNMPTQASMEKGLFEIKESTYQTADGVQITKTVKVTGKGQQYFVSKFLREDAR